MAAFLDYIGSRMIVVDNKKRHNSSVIKRTLHDMFRKCENDPDYALQHIAPVTNSTRIKAPEALLRSESDTAQKAHKKTSKFSLLKKSLCFNG